MKKTVYIHIGSPKTGTTSIQQFLTVNAKILLEEGLFYPIVGRKYTKNDLLHIYNDNSNLTNTDSKKNSIAICMNGGLLTRSGYNESDIKKLLKEFSASKADSILFSEEILFIENDNICNRSNLFKYLSKYEVKVIVYLKRSVEYLCGLWQEELRNKSTIALENYLQVYPYAKYLNIVYDLSNKIGKENIIVKSFEKEQWVNNSLIDDFLSIFKIKNSNKFQKLTNINIGFSREKNEMARYINKYLDISIENNEFEINQKIPDGKNNQKIIDSLPDEIIKKISDKYYPDECKIAKDFLNKEELFLNKYPEIYKSKREKYKNEIAQENKGELQFIINYILQEKLLKSQNTIIEMQQEILAKRSKYNKKIPSQHSLKKLLVMFLCIFVPSKLRRSSIRKYFLSA